MSRDYFDKEALARMSFQDIHRQQMRKKARDTLRESSDPKERFAVVLAEAGFGITDVSSKAHVTRDVASMLVRGE